ncbi:MAG TPA: zf-HC2 domain-containing protein [Longimicrobium sp.]|nr:zf-HC2 domain-containing protein [Longimicrobium sp.]
MMDCERFLAGYSAFRDDELPWDERMDFELHVDDCESCGRYHRVVSRGTELFLDLPELEVSDDFGARLQHSIRSVDAERFKARNERGASGAAFATFAVAATVVAVAWVPLGRAGDSTGRLPSVAAYPPARADVAQWTDGLHPEAGRITAQLARMGVAVVELPYHDLVFRKDSPLGSSLASYEGAGAAPMLAR